MTIEIRPILKLRKGDMQCHNGGRNWYLTSQFGSKKYFILTIDILDNHFSQATHNIQLYIHYLMAIFDNITDSISISV